MVRALFVGRHDEIATLRALMEDVRAGSSRVVLVEGEAGVGKTALVRHVLAGLDDAFVLTATGDETEQAITYGVLQQLLSKAGGPVPEVRLEPVRAGAILLEALGTLQAQGPLVVCVDDAHWADGPSLQAMAFALRRLDADRVLAVFVARMAPGAALAPPLMRLVSGPAGGRVFLRGLGAQEIRALGASLGREPSARGAERLLEHTGGNAFYVRALLEELSVEELEGAPTEPLPTPRSIRAFVAARLASCSREAQSLVVAAAVLGTRSPLRSVSRMADTSSPWAAFEEAATAGLVEAVREGPEEFVAFTHPLVRSAVYEEVGPGARAGLHARAAEVVGWPEAALRHRAAASPGADAELCAEVIAAAEADVSRGAWASAAEWYVLAARLHPAARRRERLTAEAMACFFLAGDLLATANIAGTGERFGDPLLRAYMPVVQKFLQMDSQGARRQLRVAWDESQRSADPYARRVAATFAAVESLWGSPRDSLEWAERAVKTPAPVGADPAGLVLGLVVGKALCGRVGDAEEQTAALPARPADVASNELELLAGRGVVRLWTDQVVTAIADLSVVSRRALREGPFVTGLSSLHHLAYAEFVAGLWDDAIVHAELAASIASDAEFYPFLSVAHSMAALPHSARGDWEQATGHVRSAREWLSAFENPLSHLYVAGSCAALCAARGDHEGVVSAATEIEQLQELESFDRLTLSPWRELAAEALVALGRLDDAERIASPIAQCPYPGAVASAARVRAVIASAKDAPEEAESSFSKALHVLPEGRAFDAARIEFAYGAFLRRAGRRKAAGERLERAREVFGQLRAAPFVERSERELRATGLRPGSRKDRDPLALTPQEQAVAHLVGRGLSNREVAAELVVTVRTVEFHLRNVYAKLGVGSRTQLAALLASA